MNIKVKTIIILFVITIIMSHALFAEDTALAVENFPDLQIFDACPVLEIEMSENKIKSKLTWPPKIYVKSRDVIAVLTEWKRMKENTVLIVRPMKALPLLETLNYLKQIRKEAGIRFFLISDQKNEYLFELAK